VRLGADLVVAALVLAARVLIDLETARVDLSRPPGAVPHGLQVASDTLRFAGLNGAMEFDGAHLTVTSPGRTRRIPLASVETVEPGDGRLRVRLVGAADDDSTYPPSTRTPSCTPTTPLPWTLRTPSPCRCGASIAERINPCSRPREYAPTSVRRWHGRTREYAAWNANSPD
jgi:hypothetical protein